MPSKRTEKIRLQETVTMGRRGRRGSRGVCRYICMCVYIVAISLGIFVVEIVNIVSASLLGTGAPAGPTPPATVTLHCDGPTMTRTMTP